MSIPMRRAIVEVRFGPGAPQRVLVEPGKPLRVGRTDRADLVIAGDLKLAAAHCVLTWDGSSCRVRDLGSPAGTQLGGEPVREAEVAHGDFISAGDSVLLVYFERATPPSLDAVPVDPSLASRALAALRAERDPLFAVIDVSRGLRVLQLLRESVDPHRSLYEGTQGDALADVAPYLVEIAPGSDLLERLVNEGWGRRWGIYLTSRRPFREVRTHLRRFLMVVDDRTDERLYFRFYDPRTLRLFLPGAPARQSGTFFGEITGFLAEGERGEPLHFTAPRAVGAAEGPPC